MSARNLAACDQCHRQKLKCIPLTHECARCKRLHILCTSDRIKQKRGRKAATAPSQSPSASETAYPHEYPVLHSLVPLGICFSSPENIKDGQRPLCSTVTASRLLDHLFTSPNQEWHTRIIRKARLLGSPQYRNSSPALLCSLLCIACYMPRDDRGAILPDISHSELVTLRRGLLSKTMKLLEPVILGGEVKPSLDDAITSFLLTNIGPSENETEALLTNWLSFHKFIIKDMGVLYHSSIMDEEEKEEWRRLWWATYIIDRHTALSFNTRPQLTDLECIHLEIPCIDEIWESSQCLDTYYADSKVVRHHGVQYTVRSLDMFGLILPLSSILGDVLEYQFLRHHSTFGTNKSFIHEIRHNIERNLEIWNESLQHHIVQLPSINSNPSAIHPYKVYDSALYIAGTSDAPKPVIYAKHIYHCLYILLYGAMDFIEMYEDSKWQASPDFLKAGEHANLCAQLAGSIMVIDHRLHFAYRFFGTYLLQSSFIFLILAQKLGNAADELIVKNCSINLQVLDAFVSVVNIAYQRMFARILRETIENKLKKPPRQDEGDMLDHMTPVETEPLDPFFYQIRWVAGSNGLRGAHSRP